MIDPNKIKKDFPILRQKVNGKDLVYLDNAATTQKPQVVIDAITNYYQNDNANIHRGVHTLAERATQKYEEAREKLAKFIGAGSSREVLFTSGTTGALNLVAQSWGRANLKKGDTVLLTVMEHHSNLVPWQILSKELGFSLEFIHVTKDGLLEEAEGTIRRVKPKLLAFTHVSNVLGTINPVKNLTKAAHDVGALVLVDGAQAVAHLPVNVSALGCDFYALSGHKMFGPTGVGVLWGREELLKEMPPFLGGGEMIKEVYLREASYKEPPYKFEAGTPHIEGVIGLGAAVDYLNSLGMKEIQEQEEELISYALNELEKVKDLNIFGTFDPKKRSGVVAFTVARIHPHDLATVLDQEGIAIRSGNHCAMPLHSHFKLVATARASFSVYNAKEEVGKLVEGIEKAKKILQ